MQDSGVPTKIGTVWANSATSPYINTIPVASSPTNGRASFTDGFPPACFIPVASGGAGPFGGDMNGIMQLVTQWLQWMQAGAPESYDGTFQTEIGGYPQNAIIASASTDGLWWLSTADNNVTDPDTGGAGWIGLPLSQWPNLVGSYAVDTGTANAGVVTLSPAPAAYTSLTGAPLRVLKVALANTGDYTINVNGLGAKSLLYPDGGQIPALGFPANGIFTCVYDGLKFQLQSVSSQTSGSVVGPNSAVNLLAILTTAGTTVTLSADEIVVATSVGGPSYLLSPFSEALNVSGTGAGGMDTGSPPADGFVSIYAIYNPNSGATAVLGTTATQGLVYGGAHMPAGYTASSLIAVWPTNGSSQLVAGGVNDRDFYYALGLEVLTLGVATSPTSIDLSGAIPAVGRVAHCAGQCIETTTIGTLAYSCFIPSMSFGTPGFVQIVAQILGHANNGNFDIPLFEVQTTYYLSGQSTSQSSLVIIGFRL